MAGSPPALGDSLPGSLTRVTGVVRSGVRTGRRPATRESQVPGQSGYGIDPGRIRAFGEVWLEREREVHGLARGVR